MSGTSRWRLDPAVPAPRMVRVTVDGAAMDLAEGQSLAVALAMADRLTLRHSPTADTPRGMFCLMGSCQECVVQVGGVATLACLEPVQAGMVVELDHLRVARSRAGTLGHD